MLSCKGLGDSPVCEWVHFEFFRANDSIDIDGEREDMGADVGVQYGVQVQCPFKRAQSSCIVTMNLRS